MPGYVLSYAAQNPNADRVARFAFFLSNFYKRKELYFRIGIYVSAASMAGAFGGLLATGLSRIPRWGTSAAPIDTWRNIFFFEGIITMLIGAAAPFVLPQRPETSKILNERERYIAYRRLELEHKATGHEKTQPHHVKRGLLNINNNSEYMHTTATCDVYLKDTYQVLLLRF